MTVKDIVKMQLQILDKDGLYNDINSCACLISDLMPCNNDCIAECETGYKVPCPNDGECECDPNDKTAWHISEEK
jgi:hypothetical protein